MIKGKDAQPVSRVTWIHRDDLRANDYNPNFVAKPELELLIVSILEDGWAVPIVIRDDFEIVDGFHRWTVSADPQIYALTDGFVPVIRLAPKSKADQMLSTIRFNRARGEHGVLPMADIVRQMIDEQGLTEADVMRRCGMEREEVVRLYDRGGMTERGTIGKDSFSKGWTPKRSG